MRIDRDLLLKLFRYFHLLITLTSIKFTKMPPPAKLAKIFCMHGRGYQCVRSSGLTQTLKSLHTRTNHYISLDFRDSRGSPEIHSSLDRVPSFCTILLPLWGVEHMGHGVVYDS